MIFALIAEHTGSVPVNRACELFGLATSSFYRWLKTKDVPKTDIDLCGAIEQIVLEFPRYGYRRVTAKLKRDGVRVNRKRVLRIMRQESLLCKIKKSFIKTTDSSHGYCTYPNMAKDMLVSGIDELWVADITYIRLLREFVYLSVVLDAFSRKVVGWHISQRIDTKLCLEALKMALRLRDPKPGLVHHSDRGMQYASGEYVGLLEENGIIISMSRSGNPYDNAKAESFFKTLKTEEVYLFEYETIGEARMRIGQFIEDVYNRKRLHSALGYMPPSEFEESVMEVLA